MKEKNIIFLQEEIDRLRNKIETGSDSLPLELGIPKILTELANSLSLDIIDMDKLDNDAYGIFRLVTESYDFEQSNIGKELLAIRKKIRNLNRD